MRNADDHKSKSNYYRVDRTKSVKYLRKFFPSISRIFVVKSSAASGGQFCDGRKTERKKVYASESLVLQTVCRKLAISCRT